MMGAVARFIRRKDLVMDRLYRSLTSLVARVRLRLRGCRVGPGLAVRGWLDLYVHERARVEIGSACRINSGFRGNAVGGFRRAGWWVAKDAHLAIADHVGMSGCTIVCSTAITIESDVMIGGDAKIYDTDFHPVGLDERRRRVLPLAAPVALRRGCFVGAHAIILKGVEIGEGAVVGAGAVVTKSIPAGEIWAGNPARRIGLAVPPVSS